MTLTNVSQRRFVKCCLLLIAVAVGIACFAVAGVAQSGRRVIEVRITAQELQNQLIPSPSRVVCDGNCGDGIRRITLHNQRLQLRAPRIIAEAAVEASGLGFTPSISVSCAGQPMLIGGHVRLPEPECRPRIPILAGWLERAIRDAEPVDMLSRARAGDLAPFNSDPALAAPRAASCVDSVESVSVRSGSPDLLHIRMTTGCSP